MEIGTVEGAVNTENFRFEAHRDVEKFDFVTVKANTEEADWLLAQINEVEKKPFEEDGVKRYKTVASASIIGYRYKGMLKKPRSVIEPDSIVYYADQTLISDVLGLDENGLYLGHLVTNPDIKIFLDSEELYKHFAVLAKTGYGKSYTVSVMVEELVEKGYPVVVIDPHGEYGSIGFENDELNDEMKERFGVEPKSYPVKEFSPNTELNENAEKLGFSSKNLSAKEIQQVVPTNLTNSQMGVLYTALKDLKERDVYNFEDVIEKCMQQDSKAKWNLVNILETVKESGIFDENPTGLHNLVERGRASVINLRAVDPENQEIVVYKLAKEMFEMRKRGELDPFFMVIEEAHNYVPEKGMGKAVCSDILRKVASEGRKFGLGIGVISQRPANVAKNILSQCNTQLILRVTNPNDLKAIAKSFEGVTSQVKNSITGLQTGVGLVLGKEYPILTNIRPRKSLHGGSTQTLDLDISEDEGSEKKLSEKAEKAPGISDSFDEGEFVKIKEDDDEEVEEEFETLEDPDEEVAEKSIQKTSDKEAEGSENSLSSIKDGVDVYSPPVNIMQVDKFHDGKKVLYPIWHVSLKVGEVAVDGVTGEISDKDLGITETAEKVLNAVKSPSSKGKISRKTGLSLTKVNNMLEQLEEIGLVEKDGNLYSDSRTFVKSGIETVEKEGLSIVDEKLSEKKALKVARKRFDSEVEDVRLVYKMFYRKGEDVFDPYLGEEI